MLNDFLESISLDDITNGKIILIDKGRIVAEGTHDELINSNSSYKNMNELQM